MITLDQYVRPHPDVVDTELDGHETVLLNLKSKIYYTLNSTGTQIWQGFRNHLTLRQISNRLVKEFIVEADAADRSVLSLVGELCRQELAEIAGFEQPAESSR
jgi:hypothetical protein